MAKFRKKPVVIEAVQWFLGTHPAVCEKADAPGIAECHIHTLEGPLRIDVGDWIIKGVNGEYYPCKPDIFEKTYEAVAGCH